MSAIELNPRIEPKHIIVAIIITLLLVIIALTSCSHKGFIECKDSSGVLINQGGSCKPIYNAVYKDSVKQGDEVKFKGKKIWKLK